MVMKFQHISFVVNRFHTSKETGQSILAFTANTWTFTIATQPLIIILHLPLCNNNAQNIKFGNKEFAIVQVNPHFKPAIHTFYSTLWFMKVFHHINYISSLVAKVCTVLETWHSHLALLQDLSLIHI